MTRKFRRIVKNVVADGIISDDERALLKTLAEEEKVPYNDAQIFITTQLKKRKISREKGGSWFSRHSSTILNGIVTIVGIVASNLIGGDQDQDQNKKQRPRK